MTLKPADAWVFKRGSLLRRVVTPVTPPVDPPPPPEPGTLIDAGSLPIGQASYPVPAGAVFVDPANGSDSAAGTQAAPLKSVRTALTKVGSGATIVLRGGVYYEGSTSFDAQPAYGLQILSTQTGLTIQNYPLEAAWFDGSPPVTTPWTVEGAYWKTPYVRAFDRTPANVRGKPDDPNNLGVEWRYVNANYPCAPFPDMVFYDGVQLQQVLNKTELGPGKFWVEGTTVGGTGTNANVFNSTTLYIGSNPTGHEVRASTLCKALLSIAPDVTLRGFGVRGYADSVPDFQRPVTSTRPRFLMENCVIEDCAMTGLSVQGGDHNTLRKVTIQRCGQGGAVSYQNDDLLVEDCRFEYNNSSHFKYAPVAAGFKSTASKRQTYIRSVFSNNYTHALWFDASVHTPNVLTCDVQNNWGSGVIVEISGWSLIADCLVTGNGIGDERALEKVFALNINSSDGCRLWNNTVANQGYNITWSQSERRYSGTGYPGYGRDGRYYPDPTMTWQINQGSMNNCILSGSGGSGTWLWALNDPYKIYPWQSFGYTGGGNLFNRKAAGLPSWLFVLSLRTPSTILFDLTTLKSTTGQEAGSAFIDGVSALNADFSLKAAYQASAKAVPLPADVAAAIGKPAGSTHIGCWR